MTLSPLAQALLNFFIGLALVIYGYLQIVRSNKVRKGGIKVEGIVFDIYDQQSGSNRDDDQIFPIIRFATKEGLLITKKYHVSTERSYLKEGQKVDVTYNPNEPEQFIIISHGFKWTPYLPQVGIFPLAFGIYQLVHLL